MVTWFIPSAAWPPVGSRNGPFLQAPFVASRSTSRRSSHVSTCTLVELEGQSLFTVNLRGVVPMSC